MNLWGITVKCTVYHVRRFIVFVWGPYISDWDSETNCYSETKNYIYIYIFYFLFFLWQLIKFPMLGYYNQNKLCVLNLITDKYKLQETLLVFKNEHIKINIQLLFFYSMENIYFFISHNDISSTSDEWANWQAKPTGSEVCKTPTQHRQWIPHRLFYSDAWPVSMPGLEHWPTDAAATGLPTSVGESQRHLPGCSWYHMSIHYELYLHWLNPLQVGDWSYAILNEIVIVPSICY